MCRKRVGNVSETCRAPAALNLPECVGNVSETCRNTPSRQPFRPNASCQSSLSHAPRRSGLPTCFRHVSDTFPTRFRPFFQRLSSSRPPFPTHFRHISDTFPTQSGRPLGPPSRHISDTFPTHFRHKTQERGPSVWKRTKSVPENSFGWLVKHMRSHPSLSLGVQSLFQSRDIFDTIWNKTLGAVRKKAGPLFEGVWAGTFKCIISVWKPRGAETLQKEQTALSLSSALTLRVGVTLSLAWPCCLDTVTAL